MINLRTKRIKWKIVVYLILISLVIFLNFAPLHIKNFISNILVNVVEFGNHEACFQYIDSKYKYALQNEPPEELKPNGRYQDCVWTLWLQGEENAPPVVKNCIKSFRTYIKDRRLIVLDENSIQRYITLPKYIIDKYKTGIISRTYFSDIVRYCLLYKYGGLWLDSTVLLTDKFPVKILNQDFFMFSTCRFRSNYKSLTASWLIYSKRPGNVIFKDIINLNQEYWKHEDKLIFYYLVYVFFTLSVKHNPEAKFIFEKMPYIPEQRHFFISYSSLYSDDLLSKLIKFSCFPIHKLSYKDDQMRDKGVIFKYIYENSILHFFSHPNVLEELQRRGLAKADR